MAYPPELEPLLRQLEATRPERLTLLQKGQGPLPLGTDQRKALLRFHPDAQSQARRTLQLGPSKGYRLAREYADLLEARPRLDPDTIDLSRADRQVEVLVLGGGGAGTTSSLFAHQQGAKVLIATKLRLGDGNTALAEMGIQATSQGHKDSPYYHYLDSLGGGHFTNRPELLEPLVREAPELLLWLEQLGFELEKDQDGRLLTEHCEGTSRKRLHRSRAITGADMMRVLRRQAQRYHPDIEVLEMCPAVELLLNEAGQCAGAVLYHLPTQEYLIVQAKAVILATGGSGRLHAQNFLTTNHYGSTFDGVVLAYRAGVPVCFLHRIQYYPTGLLYPEHAEGLCIPEQWQKLGAPLVNRDGDLFISEHEPRAVQSAAMIRECSALSKGVPLANGRFGVWLDTPLIDLLHGPGTLAKSYAHKQILLGQLDLAPHKLPLLVYPSVHYQNGGLEFEPDGSTALPGLFVAGELTGGAHGENCLEGNALSEMLVFGRRAGISAAQFAQQKARPAPLTLQHVRAFVQEMHRAKLRPQKVSPMLLPHYGPSSVQELPLLAHLIQTGK